MRKVTALALSCLFASILACHAEIIKKKPTVVFVTGDDEYRSRDIMIPYAKTLEEDYGFKVIYLKDEAHGAHRKREPNKLEGAEKIKDADLMVLFVRFRSWEPESLKLFMEHFEAGKPAVAIRTSTHAFWHDKKFSPTYFGGHYKNHPHQQIVCQVDPQHADHPMARGVEKKFAEHEGPYLTTPLTEGATPVLLAYGSRRRDRNDMIGDDSFDSPVTPAAWAFNHNGARRAMITLMSYRVQSEKAAYSQNLFYNSIFWALGYDVPENGVLSAGKDMVIRKEKSSYQVKTQAYPSPPKYVMPEGWTALFDGSNLNQWKHYDYLSVKPILERLDLRASTHAPIDMSNSPARWKTEDNAVIARVGYGDIITKKSYKDFRLRFDFLIPKEPDWVKNEWKGNSGIYLRGSHEIAILNSHGQKATKRSNGALYRHAAPLTEASRPAGEWQTYEIEVAENKLSVKLNGVIIHDKIQITEPTKYGFPIKRNGANLANAGPIRLQGECSAVRFANIAIKEL